jgi:hypothetical protein
MPSNTLKSLTRALLREAKAAGIRPPVLACLWKDSFRAQDIYGARHLAPMPKEFNLPEIPAVLETWPLAHAVMYLRGLAGFGGAAVASLIETLVDDVRWWLLEFQPRSLLVKAHAKHEMFQIIVPYSTVLDTVCTRCQKEMADRTVVHCHLPGGQQTVICARTPRESVEVISLLWVAATRCLPALSTGPAPPLILKDEDLRRLLLERYGDRVAVIAEAIRALRKADRKYAAWLVQVLGDSPDLRGVWARVKQELYGDAGGPAKGRAR